MDSSQGDCVGTLGNDIDIKYVYCEISTFLLEATGRMTENRHAIIRAALPAPLEPVEHWVPPLTPSPAEAKGSAHPH